MARGGAPDRLAPAARLREMNGTRLYDREAGTLPKPKRRFMVPGSRTDKWQCLRHSSAERAFGGRPSRLAPLVCCEVRRRSLSAAPCSEIFTELVLENDSVIGLARIPYRIPRLVFPGRVTADDLKAA